MLPLEADEETYCTVVSNKQCTFQKGLARSEANSMLTGNFSVVKFFLEESAGPLYLKRKAFSGFLYLSLHDLLFCVQGTETSRCVLRVRSPTSNSWTRHIQWHTVHPLLCSSGIALILLYYAQAWSCASAVPARCSSHLRSLPAQHWLCRRQGYSNNFHILGSKVFLQNTIACRDRNEKSTETRLT